MKEINNNSFYKKSIKEHSISAKGVHWYSKSSQYKRFEIISSFLQNKDYTLVDAGCGFCEYYLYLQENNLSKIQYIGYDCYDEMVNISKNRFDNIQVDLKNILYDKLQYADYYVSSGGLSLLSKDNVFLFITNCFKYSKKAFIFNYLKEQNVSNFQMYELIDFCKSLNAKISINDGYLENDYTIVLKK